MRRQIPRPRWSGGDSRSSAWFGLAKLCMHDEYMRVEAIRRSRRDRARAAILDEADAENTATNPTGDNREVAETESTKEEVTDDKPHAQEPHEGAEDVDDDDPEDIAGVVGARKRSGTKDWESNGNHDTKDPVISPAQSEAHSCRASSARSYAGSDKPEEDCQDQECAASPQSSKAPSASTRSSHKAVPAYAADEDNQEQQRAPSSHGMSIISPTRPRSARAIAGHQNTRAHYQGSSRFLSPRPSTLRSIRTGSATTLSRHHGINSSRQEDRQRCSPRSSRAPSADSIGAGYCVNMDNSQERDQTTFACSFPSKFRRVSQESRSRSSSSRPSQAPTLASQSTCNHPLPPTPSHSQQGTPSVQSADQAPAPLGSPAASRLQTWSWPESRRGALENQAGQTCGQPAPQHIAAYQMQGQHQAFWPSSNFYSGHQTEYPSPPRSDSNAWIAYPERSHTSQPQLSFPCPYTYQYQCLPSSIHRRSSGDDGTLVLYSTQGHYGSPTVYPRPQPFAHVALYREPAYPPQPLQGYAYLY